MSRLAKTGIIVSGVIVVALLGLSILAKILITPDRVRATVLPLAEKSLGREVQLGEIEVSLFSGILLQNLSISEPDSDEPFVSAGQVVLRYQLWPLLFLNVVIDEIRLEQPRIRIVRRSDGSFNFSDLANQQPHSSGAVTTTEDADSSALPPINLSVATLRLVDAELLFIDQQIDPSADWRYQIRRLNVAANDIALSRPFPFEVNCLLNDAPLSITGQADILKQSAGVRIELSHFDITALAPYYREQLPGQLDTLQLDLNLAIEVEANSIASSGTVALHHINLLLDELAEAPIRDARLQLDYAIMLDRANTALHLASSRIDFNGLVATASGRIETLTTTPQLALDVAIPPLELTTILAALPKELVNDSTALNPFGSVELRARLEGASTQGVAIFKNGQIIFKQLQATIGSLRPALDGQLDFDGDRFQSRNLQLRADDLRADIDLKGQNLFSKPISLSHHITSERFDLDALLPALAAPAALDPQAATLSTKASEELGPFDLPLTIDGRVNVGQTVYKGMIITDFNLGYQLRNNVLNIDKVSGTMLGGTFEKTGHVDLAHKGLDYQGNIKLQNLQADPLVTAYLPQAAGTVFGALDLDLDVKGNGTLTETLKKNLSGKGDLMLTQGRLSGAAITQGLADFVNLSELRELQFSKFGGNLSIDQGKLRITSAFDGSKLRMQPQGTIGLDGALDLALNASLSPQLVQKLDQAGQLSNFLTDAQGWGQLPLKLSGSYDKPRFTLDSSALRQQVEEKAKDELQRRLLDKMLPSQPVDGTEETRQPHRQLLDDTVRGLFQR